MLHVTAACGWGKAKSCQSKITFVIRPRGWVNIILPVEICNVFCVAVDGLSCLYHPVCTSVNTLIPYTCSRPPTSLITLMYKTPCCVTCEPSCNVLCPVFSIVGHASPHLEINEEDKPVTESGFKIYFIIIFGFSPLVASDPFVLQKLSLVSVSSLLLVWARLCFLKYQPLKVYLGTDILGSSQNMHEFTTDLFSSFTFLPIQVGIEH